MRLVGERGLHVRPGAGASAFGDFLGVRHGDVGGMRLRFGESERGAGLVHTRLKIARINFHEHLAGMDGLIVIDENFGDVAGDFRGDGIQMAVDFSVVGGNAPAEVPVTGDGRHDDDDAADDERAPKPGIRQRAAAGGFRLLWRGRCVVRLHFRVQFAIQIRIRHFEFHGFLCIRFAITWHRAIPSGRWREPNRRATGCIGKERQSDCHWRGRERPAPG